MAQYPAASTTVTVTPSKFVTKTNTAGQKNISTNAYDSVTVDSSTTAGTFSAWVQYVASTGSDLVITGATVRLASVGPTDFPIIVQIGVGGAGSETVLCDVPVHGTGSAIVPVVLPVPQRITAGSRVALRSRVANTNGGAVNCALFGVAYANLEGN